jgi:membrane protease YdiL (CAAX protease family)
VPRPGGDGWPPGAAPRTPADGRSWPQAPPAADGGPWPDAPPAGGEQWPPLLSAAGEPQPQRPPSKAARPGEPFYLPRADWRWAAAVAGLVAGAAPQALLQFASIFAGGTPSASEPVTTASAIAIALSSLVLYGWQALAAWLFSLRSAGRSLVLWGFRRPTRAYLWVVPAGLGGVYAAGIVHDMIVHPKQQAIVSAFPHTAVGAAMFVLVAVIMAPVFEEILFRGFLFRGLANSFGWVWGALISGAIFGAAHLQLDVFLPLAALGFVLAWAYHHTGSLWTNITMHALFNTIAVFAWALTG